MHIAPCVGTGDPLGFAVGQCRLAIEGGGNLECQPRPPACDAGQKGFQSARGFRLHQADVDLNAGRPQTIVTRPIHTVERIVQCRDDTGNFRRDQQIRTGRTARLCMQHAWFERGVDGGTFRGPGAGVEGHGLGVRATALLGKTLAEDAPVPDDDTADKGIGGCNATAALGKGQRARHHGVVKGGKHFIGEYS